MIQYRGWTWAAVLLLTCAQSGCASSEHYNALTLEKDALVEQTAAAQMPTRDGAVGQATGGPATATPPPVESATTAPTARVVIYSGLLQLVVSDIAQTLETVRARTEAMGGYLQEQDGSSITVRVPAARFQEAVTSFSRLGVVTNTQIRAHDVTDEMRDLRIRLENALQTRHRLLAHLEKSTKAEDTIKIEAELDRVTREIELMKGKLAAMESQVAFSVLKVQLNSPAPQQSRVAALPFAWVRQLGEAVISGAATGRADTSRRERREIRFTPPPSYLRFYDCDDVSESMSADGVVLRLHKHENYPGGDKIFWATLIRRTLIEHRSIAIESEEDLTSRDQVPGRLLVGTRDLAGQKSGYLLALFITPDTVYVAEAWGPADVLTRDKPALIASARSIEVKR